jgi:hypothetical protein
VCGRACRYRQCPHKHDTASAVVCIMCRSMVGEYNRHRLCVATQDPDLKARCVLSIFLLVQKNHSRSSSHFKNLKPQISWYHLSLPIVSRRSRVHVSCFSPPHYSAEGVHRCCRACMDSPHTTPCHCMLVIASARQCQFTMAGRKPAISNGLFFLFFRVLVLGMKSVIMYVPYFSI